MTPIFEKKKKKKKTIIANRLSYLSLNESNSQTLFRNHKRHMFIVNLNENNDSLMGKFAGNCLKLTDVIRPRSDVIGPITTLFG